MRRARFPAARAALLGGGLAAWLLACGEAPTGRAPREPEPVLPPPVLELLDPPVQRQFAERREALDAALDAAVPARRRARAYGEYGMLMQAYGYLEGAVPYYRNARRLDPGAFRWTYYLGRVLQELGRWEEAVRVLEEALAVEPGHVPTLIWLGQMAEDRSELEAAEAYYRKALDRRPSSAAALTGLGRVALARDRPEEALDHLREAAAYQPDAAEIRYALAMAHRAAGDLERARELLADIPEFNLFQQGIQVQDPLLAEVTELQIGARSHDIRGLRAAAMGRHDLAAVEFRQSLATDPDRVYARYGLGLALLNQGRAEEAVQELQTLLASVSNHAPTHAALGVALRATGRLAEAEEHLRTALRLDPGNQEAERQLQAVLEAKASG